MSNRTVRRAFMLAALVSLVGTVADAGPSGRRDRSNDRRITAGSAHTCIVRDDGLIQCWGWNGFGQLGDSTHNDRTVPGEAVVGLSPAINRPADALAITAGPVHTCALRLDTVACWGDNISGQIGDNTRTERTRAVHLAVSGAIGLALGIDHTCALLQTGRVRCWGDNTVGRAGDRQQHRADSRDHRDECVEPHRCYRHCRRRVSHLRASGEWQRRVLGAQR